MVSRREIMTRVDGNTACLAGLLLTDLFRPVSLISHSRAKDDQNDFCSVQSHAGGRHTVASVAYTGYYLFAFFGRDYSRNEWPS